MSVWFACTLRGNQVREQRIDIVGEVSIHRTRERGYKSVEELEVPEVDLYGHSRLEQPVLPVRHDRAHILSGAGKQDAPVLFVEFLR